FARHAVPRTLDPFPTRRSSDLVPQDEIERRVQEILYDFDAQPRFVVEPLVQVVVGGEVRQPNLYALSPEMTVSQAVGLAGGVTEDRKSTRLNSSHVKISYAVFC